MKIHDRRRGGFVRALAALLMLGLLVAPLSATWSIVVVDTKTGEVCVATATCLGNFDIQKNVPVIVPGFGGGAAQSSLDTSALNRRIIQRGLSKGYTPDEIMVLLSQVNGFQSRQFGVVNLKDAPATFTGLNAGAAKGGVKGVAGDLRYAIQGNVLTGPEVWLAAEAALLATNGDLSQKVMAAMEAARSFGGDGRCSCSVSAPTSCGAPPAGGFTKSAHCAFIGLARTGDPLGLCNSGVGCANGDYFLSLNVVGLVPDPDPVLVLQGMYDAWRLGQAGLPDQVNSLVVPSAESLVADGLSELDVKVSLVDIEGAPLNVGGAAITLEKLSFGAAVSVPSAVTDNGDGTYQFSIQAGTSAGSDTWRVLADSIVLQPDVEVRVDALTPLHIGFDGLSATAGGAVPFTLNLGAAAAGTPYLILGSASGTVPGTSIGGLPIPLNPDHLYWLSLESPGSALFQHTLGVLDSAGRAEALFLAAPDMLTSVAGGQLDWVVLLRTDPPSVIGPQGLAVLP
jgi:hypothetical protein